MQRMLGSGADVLFFGLHWIDRNRLELRSSLAGLVTEVIPFVATTLVIKDRPLRNEGVYYI